MLFPEDTTEAVYSGMFSREQALTEQNITLQISDVEMVQNKVYQLYLGTPGQAVSVLYGYKYPDIWDRFSDTRLNSTTTIKNGDKATVVKSVTVCEHAQPKLCDDRPTEVIVAKFGASYTLWCSGSGAPYLRATWVRDTRNTTAEQPTETYDDSSADHVITSTIVISSFSYAHLGKWSCYIENKNFGFVASKTYILVAVQVPTKTFFRSDATEETRFTWTVKGWKSESASQLRLDCGDNLENSTETEYGVSLFDQHASLFITNVSKPDVLDCTLYYHVGDKNSTFHTLHWAKIKRVGYGCIAGEYGEDDMCLPCGYGETSGKGSTECYGIITESTVIVVVFCSVGVLVLACVCVIGSIWKYLEVQKQQNMPENPSSATSTDQHQEKRARPPEMLGLLEEPHIPCLEGII